jgi:hypothetical protein
MKTKLFSVEPQQMAFRRDLEASIARHQHLRADEMLAILAHMLGQVTALQDQRSITAEMAMQIIEENFVHGNQSVLDGIEKTRGSA